MSKGFLPDVRQLVWDLAREQGCNCDPLITTPNRAERRRLGLKPEDLAGLITQITVEHDDWCELLQQRVDAA